jgi:carbon-monoxide dehydrogenase large subunit
MSKRAPRDLSELPLSQPRYLGKDMARIEDATLLTGRAEFGDNVVFPGMLFAAILRSSHAHARIKRIDTSKAQALAGVVAIVTGEDAKAWSEPVAGFPLGWAGHCLAVDKVRFVGDPVAAVAATSRYIAEDALELIEVDYEILPPVMDARKSLEPDSPIIWEHQGTNLIYHRVFTFGAVDEAFAKADLVVKDDFRWLRASGNPIETCNCIVQWRADQSLYAWGGFQGTGFYVSSVARGLRLPAHKIRITPLPHGGSFGTKIFPHAIIRIALLSRKAGGRHVKWIEDRLEHLLSSYTHGPDRIYSAEMALTREGEITGFRVKVLDDLGAHAVSVAIGKALKPLSAFTGPYHIRSAQYDLTVVATNKCPQGSYRGWGVPAHNLAMEHCVDLAARKLGLDPVEIRRRNLLRPDQFPYEAPNGARYDSGDYEHTLNLALDLAGYAELRREQARARTEGRLVGIGVYTGVELSAVAMSMFTLLGPDSPFGTSMPESARVRIDATGKIVCEVTFPWEGQGQHTFATHFLADYFGVKREDVEVIAVDSLSAGPGTGPIGSRQAVMLSGALLGAADRIAEKLRKVAAVILEANADDIELFNGQLRVKGSPEKTLPLQRVVTVMLTRSDFLPAGVDGNPEASYTYNPPERKLPDPEGRGSFDLTAANNTHVVMVEVDRDTGQVQVLKYVIADDCGVRLNPAVVEGMIQGAVAQGVGQTVLEEHVYDENGQYLTSTFMDYLLPTIWEVPMTERTYTETPSPLSPMGVKGAGESAVLATPAALLSAINDALLPLGVQCTTIPASPLRLWQLIQGVAGKNQA